MVRGAEDSRVFCAGGDLKSVEKISCRDAIFDLSMLMNQTTEKLSKLPLVSVCLVEGMVVGGGAELATATDFRLVTPGSSVTFVHAKMGVAPAWGGARRLVRLVGQNEALEILLSCQKIDLEKGSDIGFFDDTVEDENPLMVTEKFLLNKFIGVDLSVVRALKRMVLNKDPEQKAQIFAPLWGGPANREA